MTDKITPLPRLQLISVIFVQLGEAINTNILFPFLAFMIEDFGYTGHRLGYYAGGLAASFCGAQFFSSYLWGVFSDRYGRRSAMYFGAFGTSIAMIVFGTSKTYTQAVIGRILGGFLNGNVGVMKTFLTEITDDSNRGNGFAAISVAFNVGMLLAPLLGGLLCSPADKYPSLFSQDGLFGYYPYLLPCLVAFFFNLLTAFICFFFMEETKKFSSNSTSNDNIEMTKLNQTKNILIKSSSSYEKVGVKDDDDYDEERIIDEDDDDEDIEIEFDDKKLENIKIDETNSLKDDKNIMEEEEDNSAYDLVCSNFQLSDYIFCFKKKDKYGNDFSKLDSESAHGLKGEDLESNIDKPKKHIPSPYNLDNILLQRIVLLSTCSYGFLCMSYIILEETLPLFLKLSHDEGGFDFSSVKIGLLLSLSGGGMLFFSYFLLPKFASKSKKWMFKTGTFFCLPIIFLFPLMSSFNLYLINHVDPSIYPYIFWPIMVCIVIFKNMCGSLQFTAVMIQVNHSVPSECLGAVNGLGQSMAAFARAIGPALGGIFWSLSIRNHFVLFNFIITAVVMLIAYYLNYLLPKSIDMKRKELNNGSTNKDGPMMMAAH